MRNGWWSATPWATSRPPGAHDLEVHDLSEETK